MTAVDERPTAFEDNNKTPNGHGRMLRKEDPRFIRGQGNYLDDIRLPGMVYGQVLRSPYAHAKIVSIDTSVARDRPGVYAVFTGEDIRRVIPDPYYGPAFHDQPILALDKVRFVGEPVAAVVATDPHIAEAAVAQIVAEYDEMPT